MLVNLSTITDVNRILAFEAQDLYCSMIEETRKQLTKAYRGKLN